jgi:hypothetical protein
MKKSTSCIPILFCLVFIGGLSNSFAQTFDISSGGAPTITGALGGSVTGSSSVTNNLAVNILFGEISPANPNAVVKVTIPIAIRSTAAYKVTATITGSVTVGPQAIQATDVGFGANNIRTMGSQSQICTRSTHTFYSPFTNNPATSVTINAAGRATYPGTLANIGTDTTILSGPRLSLTSANRATNNGYIFDAIFAITPQFYSVSSGNATITFSISAGPTAPC